jgi:hypothetical protein
MVGGTALRWTREPGCLSPIPVPLDAKAIVSLECCVLLDCQLRHEAADALNDVHLGIIGTVHARLRVELIGGWLEAFWKHVVRRKAVGGWAIIAFALVLWRLVPIEAVQQLVLIMIGVMLSYIFLPDSEREMEEAVRRSNLWLSNAAELRAIVPPDRLKQAAQELLEAVSPERARVAWKHGCQPIIELDDHPDALMKDVRYEIWMEAVPSEGVYSVRTVISSKRILPPGDGTYWVSFARTSDRLEDEFDRDECLLRELVTVTGDSEWEEVVHNRLKATLVIESEEYVAKSESNRNDLARMIFSDVLAHDRPVEARLEAHYVLPLSTRSFPVKLASYYCFGKTEVEFSIEDPSASNVDLLSFLTRKLHLGSAVPTWRREASQGATRTAGKRRTRTIRRGNDSSIGSSKNHSDVLEFKRSRGAHVRMGPDSLLWPGSGVLFTWNRIGDEAIDKSQG